MEVAKTGRGDIDVFFSLREMPTSLTATTTEAVAKIVEAFDLDDKDTVLTVLDQVIELLEGANKNLSQEQGGFFVLLLLASGDAKVIIQLRNVRQQIERAAPGDMNFPNIAKICRQNGIGLHTSAALHTSSPSAAH